MPGGAPREGEDIPGEAVSSSSTLLFGLSSTGPRCGRSDAGKMGGQEACSQDSQSREV